MKYVPIIETIQMNKTIKSDRYYDGFPNFQKFKRNDIYQKNISMAFKINNQIKTTANNHPVVFGSSQERKRPSKLVLPSLQYDLNFNSVDRHKASPKIRVHRTKRINSGKSYKQCCPSPIAYKTETIPQTAQGTELDQLQKFIQRVKTPHIEKKLQIQEKKDEFIPMNSQELKESLFSLMNKYGLKQR